MSFLNKMKSCILVWMIILFGINIPLQTLANEEPVKSMSETTAQDCNIVLLVDKSASMRRTDPNTQVRDAIGMVVDTFETGNSGVKRNVNMAVIAFCEEIEKISPFMELSTKANRDYMLARINSIEYLPHNTGGTDLSLALDEGVKMLEEAYGRDSSSKNMIIMFSDGESENIKDADLTEAAKEHALKVGEQIDCEFYVVGLDPHNSFKEAGRKEIFDLSNSMQHSEGLEIPAEDDTTHQFQKVNYKIVEKPSDLKAFFASVYASSLDGNLIYLSDHKFRIDDQGVFEADVIVTSDQIITDVTVTDPDRNVMMDGPGYSVDGNVLGTYKSVKILNPTVGEWTIDVETADAGYQTYLVQIAGLEVALSGECGKANDFPDTTVKSPLVGKATMTPMLQGNLYKTEDLERMGLEGKMVIRQKNAEIGTYPMELNDNGEYIGYFPVTEGVYDVEASIDNEIIHRTVAVTVNVSSSLHTFSFTDTIKRTETKEFDLDAISDGLASGLVIKSVTCDGNVIASGADSQYNHIEYSDNIFRVKGNKEGADTFVILAENSNGTEWTINATIQVVFKFLWWWIPLALLILAAVIILIKTIWNSLRKVDGSFLLTITVDNRNLNLPDNCSIYRNSKVESEVNSNFRGTSFSISKIMDVLRREFSDYDDSEGQSINHRFKGFLNTYLNQNEVREKEKQYRIYIDKLDFYDEENDADRKIDYYFLKDREKKFATINLHPDYAADNVIEFGYINIDIVFKSLH